MKTDDHNHPKNDPTSKSDTCTICAAGENVNIHLNDRAQLLLRAHKSRRITSGYVERVISPAQWKHALNMEEELDKNLELIRRDSRIPYFFKCLRANTDQILLKYVYETYIYRETLTWNRSGHSMWRWYPSCILTPATQCKRWCTQRKNTFCFW